MVKTTLAGAARPALALLLLAASMAATATAAAGGDDRDALRALRSPDGRTIELKAPEGGATVVVFYSSECPISNAYSPVLNRLASEAPAGKVRFVGVCVDPDLTDADVAAHAKDFGLGFPVARDRKGALARALGAKVTPEAFVLDGSGKVRYHGRIDDLYVARQKAKANPETHELADAIAAVVAGKPVAVARAEAVGCPLPEAPKPVAAPTYSKEVARVLQKNCQECHRKGQIGPFPLENYEQARKRANDIATVAEDRAMPPWKAVAGVGPKFKHDRSLPQAEVDALVAWAAAGAPLGDPADAPPPASWNDDWKLGTPDLVVGLPADYPVPAEVDKGDVYRCFVVPTSLPKDMYISAIEYRPGNTRVVHHMLAYVDVSGEARKKDAADAGPGYECFGGPEVEIHGDLGGWAPGNEPARLPDGVGRSLPKGADVIIQVHYHPDGKPETDRSRIGLHFARKPVKQILHWDAAAQIEGLVLPAGESNVEIKGRSLPAAVDMTMFAVTPHMHVLGRDMRMKITYPDGKAEDLIKIGDWDFAWQNTYFFETPIEVPKGSVVSLVAHYDNSAGNPRNPSNPPKLVKWGEATTDEMCIGFFAVTKKGQDLTTGEKDDLHDIFVKQREEYAKRAKEERAKQKAADEAKAAGN